MRLVQYIEIQANYSDIFAFFMKALEGTMDIIARGITAGILGTLMMDTLNHLFSRTGIILKIEVGMIGRMAAGWTQGRFRYRYPGEMQPITNEKLYGVITHYGIGVGYFVMATSV
jgi:uncharacterized membrane protein YeaQ/YmgE (transglycosylase-associated protein family)